MRPFNLSLDLCNLLNGVLCPLPTYNFTGADSITLPPSIDVSSRLPGIAYKIPDLEAFAQLTLTEVGTGKVRACIQSTLSNGWSAHQKGVEWSTGGMAFLALASAVWWSYAQPDSLAPVRFLDLFHLFQTIAASGLLGLNYSSVYRAFTLNFAWSLGLFTMSPSSSIQNSINHMRSLTGGDVSGSSDPGSGAISLVNRKLSPYNNFLGSGSSELLARVSSLPTIDVSSYFATNASATHDLLDHTNVLVGGNVATVTQESSNVLEAGIPIFVNVIGIATANAFMTVFFIALILIAITVVTLTLGYIAILILCRTSWGKKRREMLARARRGYPSFAGAWALRSALICLIPVFIFALYQWTLQDSWLSVLLSVILLLAVFACITIPTIYVLRPSLFSRLALNHDPSLSTTALPITASLRHQRYYYALAVLTAIIVKTLVIAFAQSHGELQTILILVIECLLLVSILVLRPHRTRGADILGTFLAIIRVICTGPMIAFAESLALQAIPRVVVGIVIAVIYSITVVIMFLNILVNLGLWALVRRALPRRRGNVPTDATALSSGVQSLEEAKPNDKDVPQLAITPESSVIYYQRPTNPTPTHTPISPSALTPTTTLSHFSDPPSIYTCTDTITESHLGELLPRRFSFQHSRPPSISIGSHSGGLSPRTPVTPTTESGYLTPGWRQSLSQDERPHSTTSSH